MAQEDYSSPIGNVPFGNAFIVQTPTIDRITQQLQTQAQARQQYQQKEGLQTQELLNKELANVRSIDMPTVSDAYNKWKQASQPLLFNRGLGTNVKAYNQAQIEANAALGNLHSLINQSSNLNTFGKQLATDRSTPGKSNLYSEDFGDKASAFWKTPMDQLQNHPQYGDLTNLDNYRYKGMNNADFGAMEKVAAGAPAQRYQKEEQISPLQKNITPYTFGNTPAQFQQSLRDQYSKNPQVYRSAAAAWESIPQQEKDRVDQLYAQIPTEKWQQMGVQGPQAIAPTNPSDPADNLSAYKAKLYAINNNPAAGKMYSNIDQNAKMNKQFNQQDVMEALKENDREKLAAVRHQYKQLDIKQQATVLDDTYNAIVDDAKNSGTYTYNAANGAVSKQYEIKVSPALKKEFSIPDDKGHPIYPDAFRMSEDGKTVTPIFYKPDQTGQTRAVDANVSKPMTSVEFKARLGKGLFGAREAAKESNNSVHSSSGITWQ